MGVAILFRYVLMTAAAFQTLLMLQRFLTPCVEWYALDHADVPVLLLMKLNTSWC